MKSEFGIGSISFTFTILGILVAFSFNGFCLGDLLLGKIGLPIWSNGTTGIHYTVFYALIFFVPAITISTKYTQHFLAKTSQRISAILSIFIILSIFSITL